MIFYISSIVYIYIIIFSFRKSPVYHSIFFLFPIILFSALRGSSGKDSWLYLSRFDAMSVDGFSLALDAEPILNSYIYLSKFILGGGHEMFFLIHALVICFLFSLIIKKYDQSRIYLLTVGPVFLIDGLTNGMRVTIAYHVFIVSVIYRKELVLGTVVFLAHVSGAFMYIFKYLLDSDKLSTTKKIIILISVFILGYFLSVYVEDISMVVPRIESKINKYREMVTPNMYSGLADIFIIFSVFSLAVWHRKEKMTHVLWGVFIAALICILLYISILNSLAFIRVGKLFIVALCISEFATKTKIRIPSNYLLVVGLLYSLNFLRQVIFGYGFLPYPGIVN